MYSPQQSRAAASSRGQRSAASGFAVNLNLDYSGTSGGSRKRKGGAVDEDGRKKSARSQVSDADCSAQALEILKKVPEQDPRKKKSLNPFVLFSYNHREEINQGLVARGITGSNLFREAGRELSSRWKSLGEDAKAPYFEAAKKLEMQKHLAQHHDDGHSNKPAWDAVPGQCSDLVLEILKKVPEQQPNKKKSLNPFVLFSYNNREEINQGLVARGISGSDLFREAGRELAARWKSLTDDAKQPYFEAAKKLEQQKSFVMEILKKVPDHQQNKKKKSLNPFVLFSYNNREEITANLMARGISGSEVFRETGRELAARWKSLTDDAKQPYFEAAKKLEMQKQLGVLAEAAWTSGGTGAARAHADHHAHAHAAHGVAAHPAHHLAHHTHYAPPRHGYN